MIDIHTHILPAVDDGARDLEGSLAMLRMAAAAGTTEMVATPHWDPQFTFDPQVVEERLAELQKAAGDSMRIHYGCELHLTLEGIENALGTPERYAINHRSHLLVEFSNLMVPRASGVILERLIDRGLRPVIAHPERNPLLRGRVSEMEAWVGKGCALQLTAQSLLGRFGKAARNMSHELIDRGLAHFLASDAHDLEHRPPVLDEVRRYVEEKYDEETAALLLVENPQAAIEGRPVIAGPVHMRKRAWYSLW